MLWALIWGLVILVQINSNSLWQTIVPDRLLGRVQGVISVLSWSAIPLGAFVGGVAIEQTQQVALVYGVIGASIFLIGLLFSFTALGHAEQYRRRSSRQSVETRRNVNGFSGVSFHHEA